MRHEIHPSPGPWSVDKIGSWVRSATDPGLRIADMRGWGYLTSSQCLSREDAFNVQLANAHLIAAAPDLMRYLKDLRSRIASPEELIRLHELIEKATYHDDRAVPPAG